MLRQISETNAVTHAFVFSIVGSTVGAFAGVIPFLSDERLSPFGVVIISVCALAGGLGGFAFGIIYRLRRENNSN
ncbi:hypothetical protein [Candidatus Binatus sp.]|uniref:hypothetical protein n=1 Tax=Candidatus Binatus sp. TaxID=2811406 RepID=UPI003CC5ED3F